MPLGAPQWALILTGVLLVSTGVAGAAGVGPLTLIPGSQASLNLVVAQFAWKTSNLTASVTLSNQVPAPSPTSVGCPSFSSTFYWGDGAVVSMTATGQPTAGHSFAQGGIYTLTEALTETFCATPSTRSSTSQVSVAATITVPTSATGTASSGLGKSPSSVSPSFSASTSNLTVFVRDTSVAQNESIRSVIFAFGDGSVSTSGSGGVAVNHPYASAGTYRVVETVTGSAQVFCSNCGPGSYPVFTAAVNVTVAPGVVVSSSTAGAPPAAQASSFSLGGLPLAAIAAGAVLLVFPLVVSGRYGTILAVSGVAGLFGYLFGAGII